MAAVHLRFAASLAARSGVLPPAEEVPMFLDVQAVLEAKLDGDDTATLFEHQLLMRGIALQIAALRGGDTSAERMTILDKRIAERGLSGVSKQVSAQDAVMEGIGTIMRWLGAMKIWGR